MVLGNFFLFFFASVLIYYLLINKKKLFLSSIFATNRHWRHKHSLSSIRYSIIQWFNDNKPNDLQLFGSKWNVDYFSIMSIKNYFIRRVLSWFIKFRIFNYFFFNKNLRIYRGVVKDKVKTASFFKYEFCCENAKNNGRLSERIFQSFFSGTVPIYIGDKTVKKYIPKNCYIDFWKFQNIDDCYKYIVNISDKKYKIYLKNISAFLRSDKYYQHTVDWNVENLINSIIKLKK